MGGIPKIVPVIRDLAAADGSIRNAVVASRKFVAQVNRIAFGITLIEISSDLDDAIGRLSPYLPDLRLGNAGEDFSYQVNRRRGSKAIPRIRIKPARQMVDISIWEHQPQCPSGGAARFRCI